VGDRLRYGDAIALHASLLDDPSTLTGAKYMGLKFPLSWSDLVADLARHGIAAPSAVNYKREDNNEATDEELSKAQSKLSPIPGSDINN
jgi:hypothetical protein